MIKANENLSDKEKVKFDLYKILRMSILLNQGEVDKETLNKFKESSISIDRALNDKYNLELDNLFYATDTLEDEEKRLKKLVAFIKDRINERKSLIDDYRIVTSRNLDDLEYINKSSELDLYENRLSLIKEYLENSKLLEIENDDLSKLRSDLVDQINRRKENEKTNQLLEEELNNAFINSLYDMDLFNEIHNSDVDVSLDELRKQLVEAKEQKDTFLNAFSNLKSSGISGELEVEYSSYVENAKRNYYYLKEKEILYKLYKLISNMEKEYSYVFSKREDIKELLKERLLLRNELGIKDKDNLVNIYDVIKEHNSIILDEKRTQESISVLTERIKIKEKKCDNLSVNLKKPEILSILSEYSLIDTYNNDNIDNSLLEDDILSFDDDIENNDINEVEEEAEEEDKNSLNYNLIDSLISKSKDEVSEDNLLGDIKEKEEIKTYRINEIKSIEVLPTMNCGLSRLKSISVMKKVADMLGIKKENNVKEEFNDKQKEDVATKEKGDNNDLGGDDILWTPVELQTNKVDLDSSNIKVEENKNKDDIFLNDKSDIFLNNDIGNELNSIVDGAIFSDKSNNGNDLFVNNSSSDIFEVNDGNGEIIFPEPIMPSVKEEKKEDKFMWPNNNINEVDINSIFPN